MSIKNKVLVASCMVASIFLQAKEPMLVHHEEDQVPSLIEDMQVSGSRINVTINKNFRKKYFKEDFFVEYDKDIDLASFDYSILSMPFLLNVITIVWKSGRTYSVKEMDTELFYSLKRVKKVFKHMYPRIAWKGSVRPLKLVTRSSRGSSSKPKGRKRTAILYSGGVDSFSTALNHKHKELLFITAWGHWDLPLSHKSLWDERKDKIERFAHSLGGQLSTVRSNYTSFLRWEYLNGLTPEIKKWRLGAVEGLGWAGITAPILLAKGYKTLRIASSHSWLYTYPSAASPYIDNNLNFAGKRIVHDEFDKTRLQKIEGIVKTCSSGKEPYRFLKVCSFEKNDDKNCGVCRKCVSTAIGFYVCGGNPKKFGIVPLGETAVKRALGLLRPQKQNMYTLLFFKEVQERIRCLDVSLHSWHKNLLQPLLDVDLTSKRAWDIENQKLLDWSAMRHLLPELSIPSNAPCSS